MVLWLVERPKAFQIGTGMILDRFSYAVIFMMATVSLVVGLAEAMTFAFAMFLLGAALVVSLALIWMGARKKSR